MTKNLIKNIFILFALPNFEDDDHQKLSQILYYLSIIIFIGFSFLIIQRMVIKNYFAIMDLMISNVALIITIILVIKRKIKIAGYLLVLTLLSFLFRRAYVFNGIHDTALFGLPGLIVLIGLIFRRREFYFTLFLMIILISLLGYLEINGDLITHDKFHTTFVDIFDRCIIIILTALFVLLFSNETLRSLNKIKESEQELRNRAEQLAASEIKFRGLFEGTTDPMIILNEEGIYTDCNNATLKLLKLKHQSDFVGKTPIDFSPELQSNGLTSKDYYSIIIEESNQFGSRLFEWTHLNSIGEEIIIEISLTKIKDSTEKYFLCHWRNITLRKIFEKEIREKSLFIEKITEQSPDIIYIHDVELRENIFANKNIIEYLGYNTDPLKENIDKIFHSLIHPDDIKQFEDYYTKIKSWTSDFVFEFEYRIKDAKGNWRWFVGKEKEFQRESGNIVTLIGTVSEVTDYKNTKSELLREKAFNETVLDSVPGIFYIYDFAGNLLRWNKNHETLTGFSAEELRHRKLYEWFGEESKEKVMEGINNISENNKIEIESNIIYKSGKRHPYLFTGAVIKIEDKEYLIGYGIDISQRLINEKILKDSEEKFSKAFQASPVSLSIINVKTGCLIDVNETFEKITGYSHNSIIGKNAATLGIWYDINNNILMGDLVAQTGKISDMVFSFKDAYNNIHHARYTGEMIEISGEQCLLAIVVDITEQYFAEKALEESQNKFSLLFQASPNALIISSVETRTIVEINEVAANAIGLKREQLIGKSFDELNLIEKSKRDYLLELIASKGFFENIELSVSFNDNKRIGLFHGQLIIINNAKHLFLTIVDITNLKNIESALIKSEELYRTLMEKMNEVVIQVDNNDKILYVNKRFEEVLGFKYSEVVGKIGYTFLLDPDEQYLIIDHNVNRQKKLYEQYEIKFKNKEGVKLDFLVSASPVTDNIGNVIGSIGVMTDITDRKKSEELLKASEEKFRLLAENASDMIVIQSLDGKFKYVSPSCKSILGYEPEELIGKGSELLLETDTIDYLERIYKEQFQGKNQFTLTYPTKTKSNKTIWVESTSTIIRDVYNIPKEIQTLSRDITQRKDFEKQLEDAINFIKHIIDSLPIALISIDSNFNITLNNNVALKYAHLTSEKSKNIFKLYPILIPLRDKIMNAIFNKDIFTETLSTDNELGEMRYLKFIISPIERLQKPGCVILIDDITRSRNMEQLMIQSEKMLSVAGLAAGMAHEINNPLGTIVQGCQNILRRVSPELPRNIEIAKKIGIDIKMLDCYFEQRQIFEIIESMRSASSKAADIIKNMLQFSRRSESKRVLYNINQLIDQTNELANNDYDFKKKYDFKNIKIIKEFQHNLPEIKVTITEMEQVLFNLIRNAVQALRYENDRNKIPTIILRTYINEKFLIIEVEDNGPGIPEKVKSRIFEPFFTTKEVGEGTGLGLSVSYMIITTNHNGLIEVESKVGNGTKFIIKLPL